LKRTFIFLIAAILIFTLACVEDYEITYRNQDSILFVEADLNDLDENQFIVVKKSEKSTNGLNFSKVSDAKVTVIENKQNSISATHGENGIYILPKTFRIKLGTPYSLKIELSNGNIYESSLESASKGPKIDSIYSQYINKGIVIDKRDFGGHNIFLDLTDNPQPDEYYMWRWKLFEKKTYCISCEGGRYFTNPAPLGVCVEDVFLRRRNAIYDYICKEDCWKIYYSNSFNLMSDDLNNGKKIQARLIGQIPVYQFKPALLEVEQYKVNKKIYDYFKLVTNQTQNTGSLADTPPAGLVGNIKNINDDTEPVGGIFSVASKVLKTYWLQRPTQNGSTFAYGLFSTFREATPEPAGNDTTRPPMAPCVEDKYSTKKRPFAWVGQ
jgi:hypothetical protein